MRKRFLSFLLLSLLLLPFAGSAFAQTYSFSVPEETVNVYWNEDGTASIDYVFTFENDSFASPIDWVDVGLPNSSFEAGSISADVDGLPVAEISRSEYQGSGSGVAVGLGSNAIRPGERGRVHVFIGTQRRVLHPDNDDPNYASAVFSPTWFGSEFVHGTTDMSVTFHFPPGVQPEEPRWHSPPPGFPETPETGFDDEGRIVYTWRNQAASADEQYLFGASFPAQYVPESAVIRPGFLERLGISTEDLIGFTFCFGFIGFIAVIIYVSVRSSQRRKLQYLPPKISIEGHGIKRGLTAIEAAILLEQPMDKILTMILFAAIKKGAAEVVSRDPLEIKILSPLPDNLRPYETKFLEAFETADGADRRRALQDMMVDLVQSVSNKMKGFSRRETLAYYKDITKRAWAEVEAADTPEVKSQRYDEVMEWTMLDRDYEDRTQEVFRGGPVFVPVWWPRYDPVFRGGATTTRPASMPSGGGAGGGVSLPQLPGSDFAASMITGVQTFSSNVVGNVTDFTSRVTQKTNPVPVSTSTGRGGGRSGGGCACACACAGCACACAGGGR